MANGQVRFPAALFAVENQRPPLRDEIWAQVGSEQGLAQTGLQTEVKLIKGLKERKVSFAGQALQAGLLAMGHFFGQQNRQKVAVRPVLFFCPLRDGYVDTTCVRQIQALE